MPLIVGTPDAWPYADTGQLAAYLGDTAPSDGGRLLERASELIDDHIITAVYAVNAAGRATDAHVINALANATCAQVEYWLAGDEEDDILGPVEGVTIPGSQLQYGTRANRVTPMYLAPRAARFLRRAGLLTARVSS